MIKTSVPLNVCVLNVLTTSCTHTSAGSALPALLLFSASRVSPSNFSNSTGFIVTPSQFQGKLNIRELPGSSSLPSLLSIHLSPLPLPFGFEELRTWRRFLQRSSRLALRSHCSRGAEGGACTGGFGAEDLRLKLAWLLLPMLPPLLLLH